jgi:TetR/AcrR family transcriptional regulator, transcriptional repressor for nem operon
MGRPRGFQLDEVVAHAGDLFWARGFGATSIGDLEAATGLDRSSLYHAFRSKRALFEEAASRYVEENIDARLREMRGEGGALAAIERFFEGMAGSLRAEPAVASRGCMVVNAVAELPIGDPYARSAGASYRDRFRTAFLAALRRAGERGEIDGDHIDGRAALLSSATLGLFVSARIDPADAADLADAISAEVHSWRRAMRDPPTTG